MDWDFILDTIILVLIFSVTWVLGKRIYQLKALRGAPPPPVNVRLVLHDGTMIPVDTMYSPIRVWIVVMPGGVTRSDVGALTIEKLPPHTAVHIK